MNARYTRRGFLATSAAAALALQAERAAAQGRRFASVFLTHDAAPTLKALAATALESAKRAGATYADVRFRFGQTEEWGFISGGVPAPPMQYFIVGVGVRALVRGYWGFAAYDELPSTETMAKLGTIAANQATVNAKGPARQVDLAPTPVVPDGQWKMPVAVDPFTVPYDEKMDFIMGALQDIRNQAFGLTVFSSFGFVKEVRTFASSEGSFSTQTVYNTSGILQVGVDADWETEQPGGRSADFLTSAGQGWEYIRNAPFQERLSELVEDALRSRRPKPVDIGRYDIVLDGAAVARILDKTVAIGSELDRAMGYLAAGAGTSFLDDPLAMLGTYQIGSPLVNITANRSMPGGCATVKWDEEGVEPAEISIVTKGILTDFQTSRESASWLAPYYQQKGRPVRSSGGASAAEATLVPRPTAANFALAPDAARDTSFNDLVAQAKSGYAIKGGSPNTDFQALNGTMNGDIIYEIVKGKLGSVISGAELAFRAPEFWKNVVALGGPSSAVDIGARYGRQGRENRRESESRYKMSYTIQAVPALVTQQAMTDYTRKT